MVVIGDESGEIVAFEVLPESFDGIEVRAVGRQVEWGDVMPVQGFDLVPTGIVEDEIDFLVSLRGYLLCESVEELLEDETVTIGNDQADELPRSWRHRSNYIGTNMASVVSNRWSRSAFHPFLSRPGITFETSLIPEKYFRARSLKQLKQLIDKGFAFFFPLLRLGRKWKSTRDAPSIIMLVKISHQGSIRQIEILLLAKPTAQLGYRPVMLISDARIIDDWQYLSFHGLFFKDPRTPRHWSISDRINPTLVEP